MKNALSTHLAVEEIALGNFLVPDHKLLGETGANTLEDRVKLFEGDFGPVVNLF
jgi:hypothetical protein